jgi:hypothetical protein
MLSDPPPEPGQWPARFVYLYRLYGHNTTRLLNCQCRAVPATRPAHLIGLQSHFLRISCTCACHRASTHPAPATSWHTSFKVPATGQAHVKHQLQPQSRVMVMRPSQSMCWPSTLRVRHAWVAFESTNVTLSQVPHPGIIRAASRQPACWAHGLAGLRHKAVTHGP